MASNSPFSGGVSSLLRSANSTAATIADYEDKIKAFDWGNSAYTDDAYSGYSQYLQGRISKLQATGNLSDASKALSLMGTLKSATHSNISASIQRENIQIMAGGANLNNKYNLVAQQFQRALDNGDLTLAQSLESQAYSISQQIQYQAQQKQAAAESNARAAAAANTKQLTANAKGEANAADALQSALKQFNSDYTHAGQKDLGKTTDDFVKSVTPTLNALGVYFPEGVKPNYFDIVDGVNQAVFKHYTNIATIWNGTDDDKAQSAVDKALGVQGSINTAFGKMDANELAQAQADPARFHLTADPEFAGNGQKGSAGASNPQTGYKFNTSLDANGNFQAVQAVFSHNPAVSVPNDAAQQINKLHLQVLGGGGQSGAGSNGVQVVATNQTPEFIKKTLPPNTAVHLVYGPTGVQFEGDALHGQGKAIFTIAKDSTGKQAVYESSNMGDRLIGGDNGYNQFESLNHSNYGMPGDHIIGKHEGSALSLANAKNNISSWFGPAANRLESLFGGHASASAQIGGATQYQIAQANAAAARAMVSQPAPALPPISIPKLSAPAPIKINTAPAGKIAIPTYGSTAVAPKTVNPQPGGISPQSPGGFNLQGGGGIRLQ